MSWRIVLWDAAEEYAHGVASYVRESEWRKQFTCIVCHCADAVKTYVQGGIDVLVVQEGLRAEDMAYIATLCVPVIVCSAHPPACPVSWTYVWKYTPMPEVMNTWFRLCAAHGGKRKRPYVVGVWSTCGGVGTTTITTRLAEWSVRGGAHTFLMRREWKEESLRVDSVSHNLSEWLYAWRQGKSAVAAQGTDVQENGSLGARLHRFTADTSLYEWATMDKDAVATTFDRVSSLPCSVVYVDAGAGWSALAETTWGRADVLIAVTGADADAQAHLHRWMEEWPGFSPDDGLAIKMLHVRNKCISQLPDAKPYSLPYVPEWKFQHTYDDPLFSHALQSVVEEVRQRWIHGSPQARWSS